MLGNFKDTNNLISERFKEHSPYLVNTKLVFLTSILVCSIFVILACSSLGNRNTDNINDAFAVSISEGKQNQPLLQQQQPNIDAKSIFETKTAVLGNNVKNLVILIPNEAHHGNGEAKEARFINQSFLPQEVVINKGTQVIWFSGDVNHLHKILLNGKSNSFSPNPYDSGGFVDSSASTPVVFNDIGKYVYTSPDVSPEAVKKGFVMKGEINVVDQPNKLMTTSNTNNETNGLASASTTSSPNVNKTKSTSTNNDIQTVGVYMIPTKKADTYLSQFKEKGLSVDNTYSFRDVRGLARGTNSQQTLLVWTAGPNMSIDNVLAALKEITPTLPYK
jgi:plastocyanin